MLKFAIVAIGSEILDGIVEERNSRRIAEFLSNYNCEYFEKVEVRDDIDQILAVFELLTNFVDVVITTGGLGPTEDDLTREAISKFLKIPLKFNEEIWVNIVAKIEKRGRTPRESHKRMAYLPEGAIILDNPLGLANGFVVKSKPVFVALPGVPREMEVMLEGIPSIIGLERSDRKTRLIKVIGLRESEVNEVVRDIVKPFAIKWGSVIKEPEVWIRLEGESKVIDVVRNVLKEALGENVYGEDEDTLESVIGNLLNTLGLTVATCESATGGLIANLITDVSGSSNYFKGSIVAYTEEVKVNVVGVPVEMIERHSVYSYEVARIMARRVREIFKADIGISSTGIAGPTGGSEENPVGRIYIGLSMGDRDESYSFDFHYDRIKNKLSFAKTALDLLRRRLIAKSFSCD
ncbi:MAG: CinA family nicotinamide mononucleotide deamidase-related protein [Thermosulfidibacteraceae bacterium]|jgi:nicotinamide-nucleotide amidase